MDHHHCGPRHRIPRRTVFSQASKREDCGGLDREAVGKKRSSAGIKKKYSVFCIQYSVFEDDVDTFDALRTEHCIVSGIARGVSRRYLIVAAARISAFQASSTRCLASRAYRDPFAHARDSMASS